jgi:hypothetical protein
VAARGDGRVALSDLLLYASSTATLNDLETAIDSALASEVVPDSRTLGVYWETYGLRPTGEPVHFALTVEEIGVGWLRRTAQRLRLSDPTRGLRIQWEEVPQVTRGFAGRSLRVDLSRLRSGRYRMQLTASARGENPTTVMREIEVR